MSKGKSSRRWRPRRLAVYISIIFALCLFAWLIHPIRNQREGIWLPVEAYAQQPPKDVIGDLGGLKVRISKYCAEYVAYDGDPAFGKRRRGSPPKRTFSSKISSFGMEVHFPEMACRDSVQKNDIDKLRFYKQESPWINIGINAGEIYPKLGAVAADANARVVTNSIDSPTKYWFANYERLQESPYELEAYVVTGVDPESGKPARDNEHSQDVFIHRADSGLADTYISCGKTYVPGGVANCQMSFGMEPIARVHLVVLFVRSRLAQWREIRQSTIELVVGFAVHEEAIEAAGVPSSEFGSAD